MRFTPHLAMLVGLAASPAAAGWPQFRGAAAQTGVAEDGLAETLARKWTYQTEGPIESTAAIAGGVVYVGSGDGHLHAVDLATGERRWRYAAKDAIEASPTVRDGIVYVGDQSGAMHAVTAADGSALWTYETEGEISSSVNVLTSEKHGDRLVFGSYDNRLHCLQRRDGAPVWTVETDGYVHGTPAVHGQSVVTAGCDGTLRLIDGASGAVTASVDLGAYVGGSPAVSGDRAFVGTFGEDVVAVSLAPVDRPAASPDDGAADGVKGLEVAWRYRSQRRNFPFYSSPAVAADTVFIGGRDKLLHALDADTGDTRWTFQAGGRIDASPVIVGDRVYFGTQRGTLYAVRLASGEVVWRHDGAAEITASVAVADGWLVVGDEDGQLHAFTGEKDN